MDDSHTGPGRSGQPPGTPLQFTGPGRPLRALIIDDNTRFRTALVGLLTLAGLDVFQAADGARGIDVARESGPDVVITDIYMPGVGGLPTIELLRHHWPALKIIAMSAADGTPLDLSHRSVELGADRFIGKPFDPKDLLAIIAQLFAGASEPWPR